MIEAMRRDRRLGIRTHDGNGEYARKQVHVTVGNSANPYVKTALVDMVLREDDAANTTIDLAAGFDGS